MSFKKIINYNEVSKILTGKSNVIRSNRSSVGFQDSIEELEDSVSQWYGKFGDGKSELLRKRKVKSGEKIPQAEVSDTKIDVARCESDEPEYIPVDTLPIGSVKIVHNGVALNEVREVSETFYTKRSVSGNLEVLKHKNLDSALRYYLKSVKK